MISVGYPSALVWISPMVFRGASRPRRSLHFLVVRSGHALPMDGRACGDEDVLTRRPRTSSGAWRGKVCLDLRLGLRGLHTAYPGHIIGVDSETAEEWGRINVPDPLPVIDGLLAASAKVRGWTLVTRNTSDVAGSGAQLLNPFQPPPTD